MDLGARSVAIVDDELSAAYPSENVTSAEIPVGEGSATPARSLVELRRFHGGAAPHVLIGGSYTPGVGRLVLVVNTCSEVASRRSCRSMLGARRLFPGLTDEFVEPIIGGLCRHAGTGPGLITIDRFGFDPVETSPLAAELAAELLARVLSLGRQPAPGQVTRWLQALP